MSPDCLPVRTVHQALRGSDYQSDCEYNRLYLEPVYLLIHDTTGFRCSLKNHDSNEAVAHY